MGHRVVHGMSHHEPERIIPKLLAELRQCSAFDPDQLPYELALIKTLQKCYPRLPQITCFDTSFHHDMPRIAHCYPCRAA